MFSYSQNSPVIHRHSSYHGPLSTSAHSRVNSTQTQSDISYFSLALCLYPFEGAQQRGEVSVRQDDVVVIVHRYADGWIQVLSLGNVSEYPDLVPIVQPQDSQTEPANEGDNEHVVDPWRDGSKYAANEYLRKFVSGADDVAKCSRGLMPETYARSIITMEIPTRNVCSNIFDTPDVISEQESVRMAAPSVINQNGKNDPQRQSIVAFDTTQPNSQNSHDEIARWNSDSVKATENAWLTHRHTNRFSPFVTSGAEEFIATGCHPVPKPLKPSFLSRVWSARPFSGTTVSVVSNECLAPDDFFAEPMPPIKASGGMPEEAHFISAGPRWLPPVMNDNTVDNVSVSIGESVKIDQWGGLNSFVAYSVDSIWTQDGLNVSVYRRYTHFEKLHNFLRSKFPMLAVSELPEKQFQGHLRNEFVALRSRSLERWLNRILSHPVITTCEALTMFLLSGPVDSGNFSTDAIIGSGTAFDEGMNKLTNDDNLIIGANMFSTFYHPEFNLTPRDRYLTLARSGVMPSHLPDEGYGDVAGMREADAFVSRMSHNMDKFGHQLGRYKDILTGTESKRMRKLAYSLRHLISQRERRVVSTVDDEVPPSDVSSSIVNDDSTIAAPQAWCSHGDAHCATCTLLTDSIQSVSFTLASVAQNRQSLQHYGTLTEEIHEWGKILPQESGNLLSIYEETAKTGEAILEASKTSASINRLRAESTASNNKSVSAGSNNSSSDVANIGVHTVGPGCVENVNKPPIPAHPPVPTHLTQEHMLSRLQTVFNTLHAEHEWMFHDRRVGEVGAMLEQWVKGECERSEMEAKQWRECLNSLVQANIDSKKAMSGQNEHSTGECGNSGASDDECDADQQQAQRLSAQLSVYQTARDGNNPEDSQL